MSKIKSEIRKDYLMEKYVIITPGRAKRPHDIKEQTVVKRVSNCPFCPENVNEKNVKDEVMLDGKRQVLSLGNIFPAVSLDNEKAYGVQEVIVEMPEHTKELADLSETEIELVLKMYAKRTESISKDKKIDYILCFKNQGSKAGASIAHSHSQVFATEILPPDIKEELMAAKKYKEEKGTCPYCDIIEKEKNSELKVFEDKNILAFTPYASQYHYETWFFTKRHLDNITRLNNSEFKSLAKGLKRILVKMKEINLSFNMFVHQVISDNDQHFYIKIQPRDSVWAGVELGSGLVINSVPPEEAAKYFNE